MSNQENLADKYEKEGKLVEAQLIRELEDRHDVNETTDFVDIDPTDVNELRHLITTQLASPLRPEDRADVIMRAINAHTQKLVTEARIEGALALHTEYFKDCKGDCEMMQNLSATLSQTNEGINNE